MIISIIKQHKATHHQTAALSIVSEIFFERIPCLDAGLDLTTVVSAENGINCLGNVSVMVAPNVLGTNRKAASQCQSNEIDSDENPAGNCSFCKGFAPMLFAESPPDHQMRILHGHLRLLNRNLPPICQFDKTLFRLNFNPVQRCVGISPPIQGPGIGFDPT